MEAVQLADGRIRQANRNIAQIPKCLDEAKANLRLRIERREQQEQLREQEEQLRKEQIALQEEYERYWQENGRPHPDAPSVL
jgi:3'-phosphoadenosine 5'-phosphosulfate sulfotransferase